MVAMVTGEAPAGRGTTARTGEAAAAHGVDTGETADGERAQFAQGEGLSADISACQPVICCACLILPMFVFFQLIHVSALEAELSSMTLKLQWSEDDKTRLQREAEEQRNKVEATIFHSCSCCLWGQHTCPSSETYLEKGSTTESFSSCDLCLGQVAELHQSLLSLEADSELLRSQVNAVSQKKVSHTQEVTELQRKLQDAENKVG